MTMNKFRVLKIFVFVCVLLVSSLNIKANNNFNYELEVSSTLVEVNNVDLSISNINKIEIAYPSYLEYVDISTPSEWVIDKQEGIVSIDTNLNKTGIVDYLNNLSFNIKEEVADNNISITLSYQELVFGESNNRHYVFVDAPGITWFDAYKAAQNSSLNNMKGYLATITNDGERTVLEGISTKIGWIGGTRAVNVNDGSKVNSSNSDLYTLDTSNCSVVCPRVWYWADGPEKGVEFYSAPTQLDGGSSIGYEYFYKENNIYHEPNNDGGIEGYLSTAFVTYDMWNDLPNVNQTVEGYFIEYSSDYLIDPNKTITVSKEIKAFVNPISSPSPTPSPTYTPSPTSTPILVNTPINDKPEVKITCEDQGLIWDDIKQACVSLVIEEVKEIEKKIEKPVNKEVTSTQIVKPQEVVDNSVSISLVNNETQINTNNSSSFSVGGSTTEQNSAKVSTEERKSILSYEKAGFIIALFLLIVQQGYHQYMFYKLRKEYTND